MEANQGTFSEFDIDGDFLIALTEWTTHFTKIETSHSSAEIAMRFN
jgi:hypothetical protein